MDAQEFAMPLAEPASLETGLGNKTKKRKKRRRGSAASDSASQNDSSTLLHSSLSLKKRLFLKKLAKRTPWYDANELLETGRGLLLAAKLFPSPPPAVDSVDAAGAPNERPTATNDGGPAPPPGLTPEEHQRLRTALRRVAVWRGRSERGRLPHAIDVTAGLAGTLLADAEQQIISSGNAATFAATNATAPHQLRNAYAALLLRSVNGLADSYRSKSASLSVSHACALAGLPGWIVDVRHDASHGDLPGVGVCRIAAIESLRFWGGGYWRGMEGRVWGRNAGEGGEEAAGIGTRAAECLERYREAAVKEAQERARDPLAVGNRTQEALAGAKDGKEQEGEEDLILIPSKTKSGKGRVEKESASSDAKKRAPKKAIPDRTSGGPIPWWVLDDDKPKKRKKTKATAEDAEPEGAAGSEDEEKGAGGAEMETMASVALSVEYREGEGRQKSAPADAPAEAPSARDCAAEFVRTIPVDVAFSTALRFLVWGGEQHGPALLTLPHDMVASFDALRGICEPLLIALTNAYPGFVAALFVHLADSLLCLDEARRNQHVDAELADGALDLHSLDRTVRCLVRWVRHVLSRQFHMHFDRSVAMYRPPPHPVVNAPGFNAAKPDRDEQKQPPQAFDLKKKRRKNWTAAELEYMQGPLDFQHLDQIGLPLNAVCDRLRSHQKAANAGAAMGELQQLLEGVVGEKNRVVFMGLEKEMPASATEGVRIPQPGVDSEDRQSSAMLSLEDMEALMFGAKAANDTSRASVPPLGTDETAGDGPSRAITPWKVCERWDSCAIGTMPGHPG